MTNHIKSFRSPKIVISESNIHGKGIFAKKRIKKGEIIAIKGGHILDKRMVKKLKNVIRDSEMQIHDEFYLAPMSADEFEDSMIFVNHSCEPNVGILGNTLIVAMRDINAGEEVLVDYCMHRNDNYKMSCKCHSSSCRKVILGKDWQKKELQQKYGNYFSSYLLEKMGKL